MSLGYDEDVLDRISSTFQSNEDVEKEKLKIQMEKQALLQKQSQIYIEDVLKANTKQPVTIHQVQILNSQSFRTTFLNKQFEPLLSQKNTTMEKFMAAIDKATNNMVKLGLLENCSVSLNQLNKNIFTQRSPSMDIIPVFTLFPTKKFFAKTGTNIGNGEGDGYIEFQYKNLFGGAENISFDATLGTRTRSSYLLNFNTPVNNNSNYISENLFYINSRRLDWSQNEQTIKGFTNKIYTKFNGPLNYEASFENYWRIIRNVNSNSLNVIYQAGDDFKSSLVFNAKYDTRDNFHLPGKGLLLKFGSEYGGLFPRVNKSAFWKNGYELQYATKVTGGTSMILTSKAGLLYPLNKTSHLMDRFYIGGPNDVRSFTLNGLGPKDYQSSIGGDIFFNGGVSLIHNLPGKYSESGFKIHNFLNFGKLIPYDKSESLRENLKNVLSEPSVGAGVGVVYNHPMARFELNFVLPIAVHEFDSSRKGLQYGIGLSFM